MLKFLTLALGLALAAPALAAPKVVKVDPKTTIVIREVIGGDTQDERAAMTKLAANPAVKEITLVLDSPGGSVAEGLLFIQQMSQAKAAGKTIRCIGTGKVISMAFYIYSECDSRFALNDTLLLWHPIRIFFMGVLTAQKADTISTDIGNLERPMAERMRSRMEAPEDYFYNHFYRETLHRGESLAADLPNFLTIVDGVVGMPSTQLWQDMSPNSPDGDDSELIFPLDRYTN